MKNDSVVGVNSGIFVGDVIDISTNSVKLRDTLNNVELEIYADVPCEKGEYPREVIHTRENNFFLGETHGFRFEINTWVSSKLYFKLMSASIDKFSIVKALFVTAKDSNEISYSMNINAPLYWFKETFDKIDMDLSFELFIK